jgi:hypothetical protein
MSSQGMLVTLTKSLWQKAVQRRLPRVSLRRGPQTNRPRVLPTILGLSYCTIRAEEPDEHPKRAEERAE